MNDYLEIWYDCSHYDAHVIWGDVQATNVIIKAGGSLNEDEMFLSHATGAHNAGKKIHLYYWVDELEDAIAQMDHLLSLMQKLNNLGIKVYSLLPDMEQWWSDWALWKKYKDTNESLIPRLNGRVISDHYEKSARYLKAQSLVPVIVYTGNWFVHDYAPEMLEWINDFWLWISVYIYSGDRVEKSWTDIYNLQPRITSLPALIVGIDREQVVLWQWTGDKFLVPGVYTIYPTRKKAADFSCYRGLIPASEFFGFPGGTMAPTLYYPCNQDARVSQVFGVNPQNYQASGGHNGIDWAIPVGSEIYAAQDGQVVRAEQTTVGYGRHIRIQSADGTTIYGHLSEMKVKVGDSVKAKQLIGLSGGALSDPYRGYSTGPHLHFEYRPLTPPTTNLPGTLAGAINPAPYLTSRTPATPLVELFKAVCLVGSLRVRSSPDLNSATNIVGSIGYNQEVSVYEEKNGCLRIDPVIQRWCSGGATYMKRILPVTPVSLNEWAQAAHKFLVTKGFTGNPPKVE